MADTVTIQSFAKSAREFRLTFADGSSMHWPDQSIMEDWIDNGGLRGNDPLVRGLLARIRTSDPTYANIGNINNVTYMQPDVGESP